MMNMKLKLLAGCSALLGGALAKITDDSHLWAKPWYSNEFNLGVNSKGEVYSTDDTMERFIKAPLTLEGKVKNHLKQENVKRVQRLFPKEAFEHVFPLRLPLY